MKGVRLAFMFFLLCFGLVSVVHALASLTLQYPSHVEQSEEFKISARLENPDLLDYTSWDLSGETPSGEEINWGGRFFDGSSYSLYTEEWTISFYSYDEPGIYYVRVSCYGQGVETLLRTATIFVSEDSPDSPLSPLTPLVSMILLITIVAVSLYFSARYLHREPVEGKQMTIPPQVREREIIKERVLIVCPYCGAKVDQGVTYCTNCGGKM